ncbi:hypothetical protein MMC09_005429 [Bachmanniomyces sp. S44760]|nr:hypothetical protein [Bachmanniomyces sp. S44760]
MPSFSRQVNFNPVQYYSRPAGDDEAYVMKMFAKHASHCQSCAHPYDVHRSGGTLCPKGHQRALDVAQYVYSKGEMAYSTIDAQTTHQNVRIEIPAGCESVRSLLKAMERGLRIMKRAPSVSYDRTYFVQERTPSTAQKSAKRSTSNREPRYVQKPQLETAEPPSWAVPRSATYPGKGSLYKADMKERAREYDLDMDIHSPVYITAAPRRAPPVPPKDYYWR